MTNSFSRNGTFLFFLVGAAIQAMVAAGLATGRLITLSPGQQFTVAGFLVILSFGLLLLTRDLNMIFVGMATQALVSGSLAELGLIQFSIGQQTIAAVIYTISIVVVLLLRKKSK